MTEYIHYKTRHRVIARGIVLRENESVESTGAEGVLVECVGTAPFEKQPYSDRDQWDSSGRTTHISSDRGHEIFSDYLNDLGDDSIHIVNEDDVLERGVGI